MPAGSVAKQNLSYQPQSAVQGVVGTCKSGERNVAMKGGVRSKNDRTLGTRFFKLGGYKIEPLLTNR